jgi:hypothetical protein
MKVYPDHQDKLIARMCAVMTGSRTVKIGIIPENSWSNAARLKTRKS